MNVSDLQSDPILKLNKMVLPYGHFVLAYLPALVAASMFGESLIFAFVSCTLRYHLTAHRVLERARCDEDARSLHLVLHDIPLSYG